MLQTELRCTCWSKLHPPELCSRLLNYAVSYWATVCCMLLKFTAFFKKKLHLAEFRCILVTYAAPYWVTLHPTGLCCTPYWAKLHPTELRTTLLRYYAHSELFCTLLSYNAPYWAALHPVELCCTFWATLHPNLPLTNYLECREKRLSGIRSVCYWNEEKFQCRNQYGAVIRRLSPVPECSGTR